MSTVGIKRDLLAYASPERATVSRRFFKTGPGEYGEGDKFIGVRVPDQRKVASTHREAPLKDVLALLRSPIHEHRLTALIMLVQKFKKGDAKEQKEIFDLYLKNTAYINNWDLVDTSAPDIVGGYLLDKNRSRLTKLVVSKDLWKRRIAVLATFQFIKNDQFADALKMARTLLQDKEDLIHKATGWMLREIGKRDIKALEHFLFQHYNYKKMPRTMLRYSIEKLPRTRQQAYLKGTVVRD